MVRRGLRLSLSRPCCGGGLGGGGEDGEGLIRHQAHDAGDWGVDHFFGGGSRNVCHGWHGACACDCACWISKF